MSPPLPAVVVQGQGVVSADQFNTYVQAVSNFAQLRTFPAVSGMVALAEGGSSAGDGLQGLFYYNSTSTAADNGTTVIVPTGNIQGAWIRITPVNLYSYQVPVNGFSITAAQGVTSLILNPAGTLATGTITFPSSPIDGQILSIATTQIITTLTLVPAAGQTIYGTVTTMAANSHDAWQYVASVHSWFRVF
jgi:hypothetical protein